MTLRLNLLPWRERERQAALRRLRVTLVGAVIAALCVVLLVDQLARQRHRQQVAANDQRQAVNHALRAQLAERERLAVALQAVRDEAAALAKLRAQQGLPTAVFADLERALPPGMRLVKLELQQGTALRLFGLAASSAAVAQFIRNLQHSQVLHDPQLKSLESQAQSKRFELLVRLSAQWS